MNEREHKQLAPASSKSKHFFCLKHRQMSFKEKPQKEKLALPFIF